MLLPIMAVVLVAFLVIGLALPVGYRTTIGGKIEAIGELKVADCARKA
jgi:hypothetical protein